MRFLEYCSMIIGIKCKNLLTELYSITVAGQNSALRLIGLES